MNPTQMTRAQTFFFFFFLWFNMMSILGFLIVQWIFFYLCYLFIHCFIFISILFIYYIQYSDADD